MTREFEELRAEQLAELSKADQREAKIAGMSDYEFEMWKAGEITKAHRAAEREPAPQRQNDPEFERLDKLDGAEYQQELASYGINECHNLSFANLSDAMRAERRRRAKEQA